MPGMLGLARRRETRAVLSLAELAGEKRIACRGGVVWDLNGSGAKPPLVAGHFSFAVNSVGPYSLPFIDLKGNAVAFAGLNRDGDC